MVKNATGRGWEFVGDKTLRHRVLSQDADAAGRMRTLNDNVFFI